MRRSELALQLVLIPAHLQDPSSVIMAITPDGTPMAIKSVTADPPHEDVGPATIWLHVEEI